MGNAGRANFLNLQLVKRSEKRKLCLARFATFRWLWAVRKDFLFELRTDSFEEHTRTHIYAPTHRRSLAHAILIHVESLLTIWFSVSTVHELSNWDEKNYWLSHDLNPGLLGGGKQECYLCATHPHPPIDDWRYINKSAEPMPTTLRLLFTGSCYTNKATLHLTSFSCCLVKNDIIKKSRCAEFNLKMSEWSESFQQWMYLLQFFIPFRSAVSSF